MKLGQTVYLGEARIEAVFQGIAANGFVKVFQGGRQISLHPVDVGPVKARVTEFDPIWNGAVLSTKDARITRGDSDAA